MEDQKLLHLLREKPNEGLRQLIDRYGGLLYTVVRARLTGHDHLSSDVEECVADTVSSFYTHLDRYDPEIATIKTYLCVMARNRAVDLLRKNGNYKNAIEAEYLDIQFSNGETPNGILEEKELRQAVFSAILSLQEPDSSILIRKFYLAESSKEIADALGLTASTVDTRANRALQKLKKQFGGNNS